MHVKVRRWPEVRTLGEREKRVIGRAIAKARRAIRGVMINGGG